MKYFDAKKMGNIREEFDDEILKWPGVSSKEMMGCVCYLRGKNMIAFLVTNGVVISKLSEQDLSELGRLAKTFPFKMAGRLMRKPVWSLKTTHDAKTILPFVRRSYQATMSKH